MLPKYFALLACLALTPFSSCASPVSQQQPVLSPAVRQSQDSNLYLKVISARNPNALPIGRVLYGDPVCPDAYGTGLSIACEGYPEDTQYVDFFVNGNYIRQEKTRPYTIKGDMKGDANPWTDGRPENSSIRCTTSGGNSVEVTVSFVCEEEPACTAVSTLNPAGEFPSDWTVESDGITYRKGGGRRIFQPPADESGYITYAFVAPGTSFYGITMESTTIDFTEHNDVWIRFLDGGLTRRQGDNVKAPSWDWLKVYQNTQARSWTGFTVDNDPHSLSTAKQLEKGETYYFHVAGRSTRFTLHALGFIPCEGPTCTAENATWRDREGQCSL